MVPKRLPDEDDRELVASPRQPVSNFTNLVLNLDRNQPYLQTLRLPATRRMNFDTLKPRPTFRFVEESSMLGTRGMEEFEKPLKTFRNAGSARQC